LPAAHERSMAGRGRAGQAPRMRRLPGAKATPPLAGVAVASRSPGDHHVNPDRPGGITPMSASLSPNLPPDMQRQMLRQMLTIRRFEERASADYTAGKIYGVVHCYIGEEAVAVGVCTALDRNDRI